MFALMMMLPFVSNFAQKQEVQQQAPSPCGSSHENEKIYQNHPDFQPIFDQDKRELEKEISKFKQSNIGTTRSASKVIPVVVHMVHDNGPEKLSEEIVLSAIQDLNACFSGTNPNIPMVRSQHTDKISDVGICFVLAKFDPQNNPTNGIIYTQSAYTTAGDNVTMKEETQWPRDKYMNIWVVRNAQENSGISAFSYKPTIVNQPSFSVYDGVVISYWAFGDHSLTSPGFEYILAHETGHFLNLEHTWGDGSINRNTNCSKDDFVDDTPNCKGTLSYEASICGTNVMTCNEADNLANFMDYSLPCYAMFTNGQATRMNAVLNSAYSERYKLVSNSNLEATLGGTEFDIEGNPVTEPEEEEETISCTDGIKNGDEIAIDCGGSCPNECELAVCEKPELVSVTPLSNGRRAKVEWPIVEGAQEYRLLYRVSGTKRWKLKRSSINKIYLKGLKKNIMYDLAIRTQCSDDQNSGFHRSTFTAGYPSETSASRMFVTVLDQEVNVFPNPCNEYLKISGKLTDQINKRLTYVVYDLMGNPIANDLGYVEEDGTFIKQFDVQHWIPGQYFVRIYSNDYNEVFKILKN